MYFETLYTKLKTISSKIILLKNTAGNGKTNSLANIADILINNNKRVIFINAKEIRITNEDSFFDYLIERFGFFSLLNITKNSLFFKIFLKVFRTYIIIDAINENDYKDFNNCLFQGLDFLQKCNVKILLSSRSEFFDKRFGEYFNNDKFCIIEKDGYDNEIDKRSQKKLVEKYSKEFNVKFNNSIKFEKLFNSSLLFVRIFFEVNQNKICNDISLYKYAIYKEYIKYLINKYPDKDKQINYLLKQISIEMINNGNYDKIFTENLIGPNLDYDFLKDLCDDNMITCRKTILNKDTIAETEKEVIYFPFDELRDYCIARELFSEYYENNKSIEYKNKIFIYLNSLDIHHKSPLEGVLHYIYMQFKESGEFDICKELLNNFLINEISNDNYKDFDNLGLNIIFDSNIELQDFELAYIKAFLKCNNIELHNLIKYLNKLEIFGSSLTPKILLDIIYSYTDEQDIYEQLAFYNNSAYPYGNHWENDIFIDLFKILKYCFQENRLSDSFEFVVLLTILFDDYSKIRRIIQCTPEYLHKLKKIQNDTNCIALKREIDYILDDYQKTDMLIDEIISEINREILYYEFDKYW